MSKETLNFGKYPQKSHSTFDTSSNQFAMATASTSHSTRPLPSQVLVLNAEFLKAYDNAKLNRNWGMIINAMNSNPSWLTRIPEGRKWTVLHQIVFSGDVAHLNEILVTQVSNLEFRLLYKAGDGKTVIDVAKEREQHSPTMLRRIERLVILDTLLDDAKDNKWKEVKECISAQPDIVNEKPPYRRFYLAHYLACIGQLDIFQDLSKICHFKLDLLAEGKKINEMARENNHIAFAKHVENLPSTLDYTQESMDAQASSSVPTSPLATSTSSTKKKYSPGFYDDPCISFIPANPNFNKMFPPSTFTSSYHVPYPSFHETTISNNNDDLTNNQFFAGPSVFHGGYVAPPTASYPKTPYKPSTHKINNSQTAYDTKKFGQSIEPSTFKKTNNEHDNDEKTVMNSGGPASDQNLLNCVTCPITKEIIRDPVLAADGYTYEREAIEKWFKTSNRSPLTNQELSSLELKPNHVVKSILLTLKSGQPTSNKSEKK